MEQGSRTETPRSRRGMAKGRRGAALAVAAVLTLPATAEGNPFPVPFWVMCGVPGRPGGPLPA